VIRTACWESSAMGNTLLLLKFTHQCVRILHVRCVRILHVSS